MNQNIVFKAKRYATYLLLIACTAVVTYGVMELKNSQEKTAALEAQLEEVKTSKVILEAVAAQVSEENEVLKSQPLK